MSRSRSLERFKNLKYKRDNGKYLYFDSTVLPTIMEFNFNSVSIELTYTINTPIQIQARSEGVYQNYYYETKTESASFITIFYSGIFTDDLESEDDQSVIDIFVKDYEINKDDESCVKLVKHIKDNAYRLDDTVTINKIENALKGDNNQSPSEKPIDMPFRTSEKTDVDKSILTKYNKLNEIDYNAIDLTNFDWKQILNENEKYKDIDSIEKYIEEVENPENDDE